MVLHQFDVASLAVIIARRAKIDATIAGLVRAPRHRNCIVRTVDNRRRAFDDGGLRVASRSCFEGEILAARRAIALQVDHLDPRVIGRIGRQTRQRYAVRAQKFWNVYALAIVVVAPVLHTPVGRFIHLPANSNAIGAAKNNVGFAHDTRGAHIGITARDKRIVSAAHFVVAGVD